MKFLKMQNLAHSAIEKMKIIDLGRYIVDVNYHGKFNDYNANVKMNSNKLTFNLSNKWKKIDQDIQIGLIQVLASKIFKIKNIKTTYIDLYNIFMKKVHISIPKIVNDPILEDSFNRVNGEYFFNIIEKPNLRWGSNSISRLGSYEYGSDTITISKVLQNSSAFLLDFVMHHEILHKKHKYNNKNGKNYHHTAQFSKEEKEFQDYNKAERELHILCKKFNKGFLQF